MPDKIAIQASGIRRQKGFKPTPPPPPIHDTNSPLHFTVPPIHGSSSFTSPVVQRLDFSPTSLHQLIGPTPTTKCPTTCNPPVQPASTPPIGSTPTIKCQTTCNLPLQLASTPAMYTTPSPLVHTNNSVPVQASPPLIQPTPSTSVHPTQSVPAPDIHNNVSDDDDISIDDTEIDVDILRKEFEIDLLDYECDADGKIIIHAEGKM